MALAAVCAGVVVGSVPPLACRTNWVWMAWYLPTWLDRFGGTPLADRMRLRVTFDSPWAWAWAFAAA